MSAHPSPERVIGRLAIGQGRRWTGVLFIAGLGLMLVWLGAAIPSGRRIEGALLLGGGAGMLAIAVWLHSATRIALELTPLELRDTAGRRLALVEDILSVDRGAFVPKPSRGFLLRLAEAGPRAWVPGVWWRIGRRVGVGGVTSAGDAKDLAALLAILVAERRGATRGAE